mmetsp:Transcript_62174/g.183850  ORF Transcript_62174/g.183850 Transcript_62174/m.183850 type:complete len:93 (-) Transcript_62174:825-1103(-)
MVRMSLLDDELYWPPGRKSLEPYSPIRRRCRSSRRLLRNHSGGRTKITKFLPANGRRSCRNSSPPDGRFSKRYRQKALYERTMSASLRFCLR